VTLAFLCIEVNSHSQDLRGQSYVVATRSSSFSNLVPILLLPPSEGKALDAKQPSLRKGGRTHNGWDPGDGAFASLAPQRLAVVEALSAASGGSEGLLGVKGAHLMRAQSANSSLPGAPTLPAWQRYTGVVWDHLDPATLSTVARRRIVVVSGLLGLVRGDDPVPDYRLKMSANLRPMGKLSTWWRDDLTEALCKASRRKIIIDLLPQEHSAAWMPGNLPRSARGVKVSLIDRRGRPGGHFAKAAKGELARAILTDGLHTLDSWHHDRFDIEITELNPNA
jgi:cytoplasmic iron level regulating protein YaaA (DUF328/UPF0246 family)